VPADQATEQRSHGIGPQKRPVLLGEHEAEGVPTSSPARRFGQLARLMSTQDIDRAAVYRHEPGSRCCLRGTELRTLPSVGYLAGYEKLTPTQVNITPLEPERRAACP
jgi:hypothetical protein